jgi:RpiB/LacA/LacB family sugar-phosphate isomerase
MRVALGVDHRGFAIKDQLLGLLEQGGHEVLDLGTHSAESVDYPDIAKAVGDSVRKGQAERGIIVCGSGAGAVIAANKLRGIRCAQAHDTYTAHQSVEHDDANVLALGSGIIGIEVIREVVGTFLAARFDGGERYRRRIEKVEALEQED